MSVRPGRLLRTSVLPQVSGAGPVKEYVAPVLRVGSGSARGPRTTSLVQVVRLSFRFSPITVPDPGLVPRPSAPTWSSVRRAVLVPKFGQTSDPTSARRTLTPVPM